LQKHFTEIPAGLGDEETIFMKKRRKMVLRIMEEMHVLDMTRAHENVDHEASD
jgi:hypothetical protein